MALEAFERLVTLFFGHAMHDHPNRLTELWRPYSRITLNTSEP